VLPVAAMAGVPRSGSLPVVRGPRHLAMVGLPARTLCEVAATPYAVAFVVGCGGISAWCEHRAAGAPAGGQFAFGFVFGQPEVMGFWVAAAWPYASTDKVEQGRPAGRMRASRGRSCASLLGQDAALEHQGAVVADAGFPAAS
jgi:hypothetical protein